VTVDHAEQIRQAVKETEAVLRERFGDDHPLLTPGLFRGSLRFQSASWALGYDN